MIEFDLYTFAVIASAIVGVIALIGGIIWYLPKHILGRKERELDELENSHFRIVLVRHLNEILHSKVTSILGREPDVPPRLSSEDIRTIQEITSLREEFRTARTSTEDVKDSIAKYYIFTVIFIFITLITGLLQLFLGKYSDVLWVELFVLIILFSALARDAWRYREELIELRDRAIEINDDLTIEESTQ